MNLLITKDLMQYLFKKLILLRLVTFSSVKGPFEEFFSKLSDGNGDYSRPQAIIFHIPLVFREKHYGMTVVSGQSILYTQC